MGIVPRKNRVALFLLFNAVFFFSVLAHKNRAMRHPGHEQPKNSTRSKGKEQLGSCNLFQGSWVFDIQGSPLYDSSTCPFINPEFDCLKYGRPDTQFLKYSWNPDNCVVPRFDGVDFLNKQRGKNIMFVGDSLSLNQWNSLTCMVHASAPQAKYSIVKTSLVYSVTFEEYAVSILLYHSSYLVDILTEPIGRVLNLGSILGGNVWKDMDVLIFNTWHWWLHTGKSQPWEYVRDGSNVYKDMDRATAFYKGLTMWGNWVDNTVNSTRTRVFFQGISPTHYNPREWNGLTRSCSGEAEPLSGSTYPGGSLPAANVLTKVLSSMKKPVFLLDITTLSQLRKDAHPETYSGEHPGTDCSHWCLPGLPDTWNLLFNAALCI